MRVEDLQEALGLAQWLGQLEEQLAGLEDLGHCMLRLVANGEDVLAVWSEEAPEFVEIARRYLRGERDVTVAKLARWVLMCLMRR